MLDEHIEIHTISHFFRFDEYWVFLKFFHTLENDEIQLLESIIRGQNINRLNNFPAKRSKKELHLFRNISKYSVRNFENKIQAYSFYAKILAWGGNRILFYEHIKYMHARIWMAC